MTLGQVTYYDFQHCRAFLEDRARQLRESSSGLDALGLFRELFYSFSYESLEKGALTLGHFDSGVVYLFIPGNAAQGDFPRAHKIARTKALEMLGACKGEPPVVLELLAAQTRPPAVGERGRMERWMRPEFLDDVVLPQKVTIHLYFDGGAFHRQILQPQLEQRGFTFADDYLASAKTGELRVRHPAMPGKLFKIPWLLWVRELMGGGYSLAYLVACLGLYLQRLEQAVGTADPAAAPSEG